MKILLVTARFPWPPRRGDQLRAVQAIEVLAPGHEVTLLAPAAPGASPAASAGCRHLSYRRAPAARLPLAMLSALAGGWPLQTALFSHPDLGRQLHRLASGADLVILQLARLAPYLDALGTTPLLVDLIDSLSLNLARRAAVDRPWLRPLLAVESRLLARAEARLLARARQALVVSERDRRHLAAGPAGEAASRLRVLPLALSPGEPAPAPAGPPRVVMTGNLGYFPNADGARWLLERVWPALARRHPQARLVLAGARPDRRLRAAARAAGAELLVSPADLQGVLRGAAVALAPLRCGSGLPIKILEAWALGVPVVASPWAAAGTTARAGEDLVVADGPEEWVTAISRLLSRPEERRRLGEAGRRRLAADYGTDEVRRGWLAAVAEAVRSDSEPAPAGLR